MRFRVQRFRQPVSPRLNTSATSRNERERGGFVSSGSYSNDSMKKPTAVITDWCYHESYDEQTRERLSDALIDVAKKQIEIAFAEASQVAENSPKHDNAAYLHGGETSIVHKGERVALLVYVASERGRPTPHQILLYVGPFTWTKQKAASIQNQFKQRALDEPKIELSIAEDATRLEDPEPL
jgi:hypothetical protein